MDRISAEDVCARVQPGDVIAFGGSGWVSELIKLSMRAPVSHTGVILTGRSAGRADPEFVESTMYRERGQLRLRVRIASFQSVWRTYQGTAWWLPLRNCVRTEALDAARFDSFLRGHRGMPFDLPGGAGILLREMWEQVRDLIVGDDQESFLQRDRDLQFFFCSELVAAAFQDAGLAPRVSPNDVSPIDLCRWNMYDATYFQRAGDKKTEIPGYSSRPVGSTFAPP